MESEIGSCTEHITSPIRNKLRNVQAPTDNQPRARMKKVSHYYVDRSHESFRYEEVHIHMSLGLALSSALQSSLCGTTEEQWIRKTIHDPQTERNTQCERKSLHIFKWKFIRNISVWLNLYWKGALSDPNLSEWGSRDFFILYWEKLLITWIKWYFIHEFIYYVISTPNGKCFIADSKVGCFIPDFLAGYHWPKVIISKNVYNWTWFELQSPDNWKVHSWPCDWNNS